MPAVNESVESVVEAREARHAKLKTSFRTQANALFRKNAKQQLRSWKVNLCLLSCAILFPLLMLIAQAAITNAINADGDGKCGCKCTSCCQNGNENCFDPETRGLFICPEDYTCEARDTTTCGYQYSTARQSQWCSIPDPSVWPALWRIPRYEYRAQPWAPDVAFLYTGNDLDTASSLIDNFFTTPSAALDVAQAQVVLQQFGAALQRGVFMGDVFSRLNYNLSSASGAGGNLYTDPAFTAGRNITNLVRNCANDSYTASLQLASQQLAGALQTEGAAELLSGFNSTYNCSNVVLLQNETTADLNTQLYCGFGLDAGCGFTSPQQYAQAWDFQSTSRQLWNISMYFNNTDLPYEGGPYRLQRVNAGLNMAASAWVKWALQGDWAVRLYGLQAYPTLQTEQFIDFATLLGPIFYTWLLALLQPVIIYNIVYEKANRLRVMMAVHGLGDTPYWLIQYTYWLVLYITFVLLLSVFGVILRLSVFTKTSAALQIVLFLVWGFNMIAFSFLLSTFFKNPKTATTVAFVYVFAVALLASQLLDTYIANNAWWLYVLQLIPELALYRALFEISNRASLARTYGNNFFAPSFSNAEMSGLGAALITLAVQIPIFVLVALYLDKVVPSPAGVHQHWLFCLPGARKRQQRQLDREAAAAVEMLEVRKPTEVSSLHNGVKKSGSLEGHDVQSSGQGKQSVVLEEITRERERVESIDASGSGYSVVIRNLVKVFPKSRRHAKTKVACGGVSFAVRKGECFGLLGPNGAGKTTLLSMLTGFLEPTSGRALVDGLDVRTNIKDIYHLLGVCPQQDLLWENMTAREHLLFYGRLKNLRGKELHEAVQTTLDAVNLGHKEVANKVAGKYSGGMKRRLSVAISLMGKPPVILTDECSTGLDPSSRRTLWAAISAAKQHSGIILTTHSMEEAAVLCDRLGIFVDGQLVVLGNPKYLGQRYGGYLVFTLTTPPQQEAAAAQLVMQMCPTARQMYALGGTQKYELPTQDISLAKVFDTMQKASAQLHIEDWGVANATLEEVFIKFARKTGVQGGS